jgi:hypothetical protein
MTTAERRRRRRRGGGLRVPSDNVPRRTNPPVVAPVPEDPSLAMSIAYSFTSEASEPVPRVTVETPVPKFDPVAPEAMPTVIDPPTQIESQDFEMKTREMSAVDLKELGLESADSLTATDPNLHLKFKRAERGDDVDVNIDDEETTIGEQPVRVRRERVKTVALSDEDLEEVRESIRKDATPIPKTRAQTQPSTPPPVTAQTTTAAKTPTTEIKPLQGPTPKKPTPPETKRVESTDSKSMLINTTQELSALDLERADSDGEPMSVPDIDIQELSDRAESSGEIEVDVDEDLSGPKPAPVAAAAPEPAKSTSPIPTIAPART